MINFGYSKSKLTGDENIYNQTLKSLPEKYELSNLPDVIDQGSRPICVVQLFTSACLITSLRHIFV